MSGIMGGVIILLMWIGAYFLPTLIAKRDKGMIFVLNFFLGWTLVGWAVALALALRDEK